MRDHWVTTGSSDAVGSPSTSSAPRTLLPEPHPGFPGYRGPELLLETVDAIVACLVEGCGIAPEQARPIAIRLVVRLGDEHGGRFIWFPRRVPNASRLSWLVVTDNNCDFVEAVREHGPALAAAQFGFPLKRATKLAGKLRIEARAAAVCRIP